MTPKATRKATPKSSGNGTPGRPSLTLGTLFILYAAAVVACGRVPTLSDGTDQTVYPVDFSASTTTPYSVEVGYITCGEGGNPSGTYCVMGPDATVFVQLTIDGRYIVSRRPDRPSCQLDDLGDAGFGTTLQSGRYYFPATDSIIFITYDKPQTEAQPGTVVSPVGATGDETDTTDKTDTSDTSGTPAVDAGKELGRVQFLYTAQLDAVVFCSPSNKSGISVPLLPVAYATAQ
jgi:hypothetical protein